MDLSLIVYLAIIISQLVILAMCAWWWYVYPKASVIFKCFTALSASIILNAGISFGMRLGGVDCYIANQQAWWWKSKHAPVAIVSVIIMVIFIGRLLEDDGPAERRDDGVNFKSNRGVDKK